MPRMKTVSPHVYAGVKLLPGEEFDAEDKFVGVLTALGRAAVINNSPRFVPEGNYPTREMAAGGNEYETRTAPRRGRPRREAAR